MEKLKLKRYDVIINRTKSPYLWITYLFAKNEKDAIYIMDNIIQIMDIYESYEFTETPKKTKRYSYEEKLRYYNSILRKLDGNGVDISQLI